MRRMKIKVEPFLMKKGNRVAKGAIEFEESILKGWHLVGFTICDDAERGLFVLFPASETSKRNSLREEKGKPFFFLRPSSDEQLESLENQILDVYEEMVKVNKPRIKE